MKRHLLPPHANPYGTWLYLQVIKTKGSFPTRESVRKLLYLVNQNTTEKWNSPIREWARILNQLAIRFEERMSILSYNNIDQSSTTTLERIPCT